MVELGGESVGEVAVKKLETVTHPDRTVRQLTEAYLADGRPWVVAFSGGKDSTAVLQLVVEALLSLKKSQLTKPVYVISSDTRVEAPNIVAYVKEVLGAIEAYAQRAVLPISCEMVQPSLPETFWSKLIAKGYPPPTRWFRWCTTNMKIKPSRRSIEKIAAQHGSVILLLGSRRAESANRSRAMSERTTNIRNLNPHHEIPNAYVLAPISEWSDDDVWGYLWENNPPPWERSHDQMLALYRQSLGGECPVVMDLNTPSCGGSRFGCWTCTVVKLDRSMEGFIESGEEWMRPLAEFRNWLKEFRELPEMRMTRRRDGSEGPGPFTAEARKEILERLFEVEGGVGITLISDEEIGYIQGVWSTEFDLEDSAINLARRFGREFVGGSSMPLDEDDLAIFEDLIADHGLNPDLLHKVLSLEEEFPNLDRWGARPDLKRRLEELILVAEKQGAQDV